MAESIIGPFVEKLADYTIAAISRQFKYMFHYHRNIQNLRSKVQDLKNKRNDVQLSMDGAKRNANATKKITVIAELQEESKFDVVGVRAPLKLMSFYGSEALKTRISTKKKIIEDLEDTGIKIVGICGLPGVSKTIMTQEVMTQVLKDKLFDEVAKVVVSMDVDIIKIQDKLAEMHGLSIDEKIDEDVRAARLAERLTYDKKRRRENSNNIR
ncbi:disease resistance At4g27190-like [Olea europaea subsp. europaea]|uniref:Disease resistance At4g27190-like n=1 Tax=Olea europaea subsp. europaea TaxID=158383 RepID=A0A8S0U180_OLEEU|nr:disease resistance At4g27190-like [Olea europaea subsp. europaea]